jgi:hypothetical protein
MAEQETLKLVAQVVDQFSVPIRDMQRQIGAMADQLRKTHKVGIGDADAHMKAFRKLREETHELGGQVKGVVTPAMAAFGVTTLSVAGAIAAITKSVGDFGTVARNLSNLSHFSGLTVQDVRVYEELAAALGSSKTEMDGFITSFSTNMDQWRRLGRGQMAEFFAGDGTQIRNLGIALRHTADNAQALGLVFGFLADNRYTDVQKKLLTDAIHMPAAFASAGAGARELMAKLNTEVKPLDKGWEQRKQRYLESMDLLSASWSNLSLHIGDTTSTLFADMADDVRKFIDKNGPEIEKFGRDVAQSLEGVDWPNFVKGVGEAGHDIAAAASEINKLVESTTGWKTLLEFFVGYKVASILGITAAVRGLAASFGLLGAGALASPPGWVLALLAALGVGAYANYERRGAILEKQKEATPGWMPSDKTELQKLRDWWGGTAAPAEAAPAAPAADKTWLQRMREGLFHKESYTGGFESEGPNPLRAMQSSIKFPAEETLGGTGGNSTNDAINTIAIGTRKGVYDGMIDYYQYLLGTKSGGEGAPGGAGGVTRASFGLRGQGGSPAGTGRASGLGGGIGEGGGLGGGEDNVRPGQGRGKEPETEATADFWRRHGYPESAVAGIIGNLKHETGGGGNLNPNDVNRAEGAIGKYQDRLERAEGLKAWAAKQRKDWRDPRMQDEYALHELETNPKFGGLRKRLMDPNVSPEEKATAWNRTFEGSADRSGGRERTARAFYDSTKQIERTAAHFSLDQIRRAVGGGSIGDQIKETLEGGDTRGRANFMRGQFGVPGTNLTKITTAGGHSLTVNRESAPYFKGFLEELEKGGAPIHQSALGGYNFRNKVGASGLSQHAYGNAIDVNQLGRNVTTGDFAKWVQSHRDEFNAAERKWHMYGGERFNDFGHFEWGGVPFGNKEKMQETAALHGAALREHFGHRGRHAADLSPGDLLKHAQRVGMAGTMQHTVKGAARLQVDFNNMPRGTQTKISGDGMFTELALNRGRTPRANQEA